MALVDILPPKLKVVQPQSDFFQSTKRFNIVPAGRRSGKTMTGKMRAFVRAFEIEHPNGRVVFAAPTHNQAKMIFWPDIKRAFRDFTVGKPRESELAITLFNGIKVQCTGLDKPARIEGAPLDHILMDEYADMRPEVWSEHIRPMLAERNGTADFTGTPGGRNHFYDLWCAAQVNEQWGAFTWTSESVLPLAEIEELRQQLDPKTYDQEIRASFVNFAGRAYYAWDSEKHLIDAKPDYEAVVAVCLDFNVEPGVALLVQEFPNLGTVVVDEVYIPKDSNTPLVCSKLIDKLQPYKNEVHVYGDATGGNKGTAKIMGSDWDLVRNTLRPILKDRIQWRVPRHNPPVRDSVNAVNGRASAGMLLVSRSCRWTIRDLEGTERNSEGNIVKIAGDVLTHLSDALRYYVAYNFPVQSVIGRVESIM